MRPDGRPSGSGDPEQARVFFALWPDAAAAAALQTLAQDCAREFGGRAGRCETLHLTLAFVGDVPLERLSVLREVAGAVTAPAGELCLDRLGFWAHNRILWAGTRAVPPELGQLVRRLGAGLKTAGAAGTAGGGRSFVPHVTLVRKLAGPVGPLPEWAPVRWVWRSFVLVRSRLSAAGAAYETLGQWPLAA